MSTATQPAASSVVPAAAGLITLKHAFGASFVAKNTVHYVDEATLVHVVGRHVVIEHAHGQSAQVFISPILESCGGISAVAISPNRKFLAVAEYASASASASENGPVADPVITVYDVQLPKRKKVMSPAGTTLPTGGAFTQYTCLAFSADSRFLAAQTNGSSFQLTVWQWEKSRLLAHASSTTADEPIHQVSFSPRDSSTLLATGDKCFKTFKFKEGSLVIASNGMQTKREPQNYLCHTWLSQDRVLLATETGDLLLCENFEFKTVLPQSPSDGIAIETLVAYGKGFVCGGNDGSLILFERVDAPAPSGGKGDPKHASSSGDMYRKTKRLRIENKGEPALFSDSVVRVRALTMNPQEEMLAIGTDNGQIFSLNLSATEFKGDEVQVEPFSFRFHSREITGVATCVRRPLFATSSLDKSVRIWNYADLSLEICKFFEDEAYSVAMHPSGFHLLVGFRDKLRLCNVLMDDIRPFKEFPIRQCRECKFSNGGSMFAAVNGNMIQVYSTYTSEQLGFLRGHNGKVRSLVWGKDDSRLFSCGVDGAVYEWSVKDLRRDGENVVKTCQYFAVGSCGLTADQAVTFAANNTAASTSGNNSSAVTGSGSTFEAVFASASDKTLKVISDSVLRASVDLSEPLGTLTATRVAVLGGTDTGTLRSIALPIAVSATPGLVPIADEIAAHKGPLTHLAVTPDESILISAGDDGAVFLYEIRSDKKSGLSGSSGDSGFAEEILVTKTDLEEKLSAISDLKAKVDELKLENQYQLRKKEFEYSEKMKEVTESYRDMVEKEHVRYESLEQERLSLQLEWETRYREMEDRYQAQVSTMETQYQQKIMAEVERVHALQEEKDAMEEHFIDEAQRAQHNAEQSMQDIREHYEERLKDAQDVQESLELEKADLKRENDEMQRQLEEDADKEIEDLKELFDAKLSSEKDTVMRLRGEHGVMKKKFDTQTREIQQKVVEITRLKEEVKTLNLQIKSLEKDIKSLKNEIRERDETIGDKEKRIYDLKKKNQELEKFKFVLDYKINELKKQIEPREEEIAEMRTQIKEMDVELERYHTANSQLELAVGELKLKIDSLQQENNQHKKKLKDTDTFKNRLRFDLFEVLQFVQDPKNLKDQYRKLYSKYAGDDNESSASSSAAAASKKKDSIDENIEGEYQRQIEYLERTVDSLKKKLGKDSETHKGENSRIMSENVTLIKEINELRREMKSNLLSGAGNANASFQNRASTSASGPNSKRSVAASARPSGTPTDAAGREREIEMQRLEIQRMRNRIEELEDMLARQMPARPISRERLPPMDGFRHDEEHRKISRTTTPTETAAHAQL
eukprot:ANDGO_00191.mRNA.1 hypothetical protein